MDRRVGVRQGGHLNHHLGGIGSTFGLPSLGWLRPVSPDETSCLDSPRPTSDVDPLVYLVVRVDVPIFR